MPEHFDVIVLGVGGHGSAALAHLAQRGAKVLGIEQFDIGHANGSSHGLTRIIRLAYHEESTYVPLLKRAYELWRELEQQSATELLTITGSIDAARVGPDTPYNSFERSLQSCREHGLDHEVLSPKQINDRFPGYMLPADFRALYQPQGGILYPERCIWAHVQLAQRHGAALHTQERALRWTAQGDRGLVTVWTNRGSYTCDKLVLTAGAWLSDFLPTKDVLQPERQVIAWFEVLQQGHFERASFPVCVLQDHDDYWYLFPKAGHPGMKLGKFNHLREATAPGALRRDVDQADEECLRECLRLAFPTGNGQMLDAAACMFTNTQDHHFLVDLHPRHKQVVICSACSGHGFKFCSVIGEVLADLALEGSTRFDIEFLRINSRRPGFEGIVGALHAGSTHIRPPSAAYNSSKL